MNTNIIGDASPDCPPEYQRIRPPAFAALQGISSGADLRQFDRTLSVAHGDDGIADVKIFYGRKVHIPKIRWYR